MASRVDAGHMLASVCGVKQVHHGVSQHCNQAGGLPNQICAYCAFHLPTCRFFSLAPSFLSFSSKQLLQDCLLAASRLPSKMHVGSEGRESGAHKQVETRLLGT